jgi:hypothetical protein
MKEYMLIYMTRVIFSGKFRQRPGKQHKGKKLPRFDKKWD